MRSGGIRVRRIWNGRRGFFCTVLSFFVLFTGIALSVFPVDGAPAHAAAKGKSSAPLYRRSGPIPGTNLEYEGLNVDSSGHVSVTVSNTGRNGVFFTVNFAFYGEGNRYLTGFVLDGHVSGMTKNSYSLRLKDARKVQESVFLKVLGRAGRAQEE